MRVIGVDMGGVAGECVLVVWLAGPRPLGPFPLTLALSHVGERGSLLLVFSVDGARRG